MGKLEVAIAKLGKAIKEKASLGIPVEVSEIHTLKKLVDVHRALKTSYRIRAIRRSMRMVLLMSSVMRESK